MSITDAYHPINCDDYESLELACQKKLVLTVKLRNGEIVEGKAEDVFSKKNVEYLHITNTENAQDIRLDHIESFSHHKIGTIVIRQD